MSVQKYKKTGDSRTILEKIRTSLSTGNTTKLFEDDYFIFELIKLIYDDALDTHVKIEILTVIEQYGSGVLPTNSVDQAISALLDIFKDTEANTATVPVSTQLLITITTIFIVNVELLETDLCMRFVNQLTEIVTKTNNVSTRRLRASCCQCLVQLVTWKPGLLWRWKDVLANLAKEEKTDVCQDYMHLYSSIITHPDNTELEQASSELHSKKMVSGKSSERQELLPMVSHIMENMFLLTPAGLASIASAVAKVVRNSQEISPSIFKPLMLQYLSVVDPTIVFLMLHFQKKFKGEILSASEEKQLLKKALDCVNQPNLGSYTRLLICQCISSYLQDDQKKSGLNSLAKDMRPVVFDPLDLHFCKLTLLGSGLGADSQGRDLSADLHYLKQLAETTGGARVTSLLFHLLFLHVKINTQDVHTNVLRITKKLFKSFPHLIPVIVDFLRAVKANQPHSALHKEILSLLHDTVLTLDMNTLLDNYNNYLQVFFLSAQDASMLQQKPIRRLLELVSEAKVNALDDWALGCLVLSICRTMILHHHTDILYPQMGDLLCFMMNTYSDCDIRDHARFYYALLTLNSDVKAKEIIGATLIEGIHLGENIADFFPGSVIQAAPAVISFLEQSPVEWDREELSAEFEMTSSTVSTFNPPPVTEGLEDYWKQLSCLKTSFICQLKVNLNKDSDYDHLLAVSFVLAENTNLVLGGDVCVPYLDKAAPKSVLCKMSPKAPLPMSLHARAVFGYQRSTYECDLTPLKFELKDFLLPFPWHVFNITDKQKFFSLHWNNYCQKSKDKYMGVESVKILKCSRHSLMQVWKNGFISSSSSCAGVSNDEEDYGPVDHYMFFLPPHHHLLLSVRPRPTDVVVHIASDLWQLLIYLDAYLDHLMTPPALYR
ncbi:AP-5 complex subunit beta-1-like [Physella acuta]|uniref:AP-5 complex subunit beta-1-like n=1 Tax=Physella acuta TaxID=109671 RepID=UPI0027DD4E20|nr:AP-5 complex subunit beta-1-like [Physella acuta]XP_059152895.1 AP-5 complex subunit beta-1-like [Physella acuta]